MSKSLGAQMTPLTVDKRTANFVLESSKYTLHTYTKLTPLTPTYRDIVYYTRNIRISGLNFGRVEEKDVLTPQKQAP